MKIMARALMRDTDVDHDVADSHCRHIEMDENGHIKFVLQTKSVTLSYDAKYNLFITIEPEELDKIYRFSMTTPTPKPKTTAITRKI
jgi:hypothetical protein